MDNKGKVWMWIAIVAIIVVIILLVYPYFMGDKEEPVPEEIVEDDTSKPENPDEQEPIDTEYTQKDLNEESVLALAWLQNSGEYSALCYQAFNVAKMAFDELSAANESEKKKAVVVDVDETVLDNSYFNVDLIGTENAYSDELWNEWVEKESATAVPGAVEFLEYVAENGGEVFYVTNRKQKDDIDLSEATINNLKEIGFPNVDETHLMLRTAESSKEARRQVIEENYEIVLLVGDNLNDFSEMFNISGSDMRKKKVEENKLDFGKKFIVLPNPVYGDWEGNLGDDYFKMSPEEKSQTRLKSLTNIKGTSY